MELTETLQIVVDLSMASVEIGISNAYILSGTSEVLEATSSMANALEELSVSIGELRNAAEQSSQATWEISDLSDKGNQELDELEADIRQTGVLFDSVSDKTRELKDVVANLSKVVELISKIAGQTNLLALNTAIEAARAGEQGKGFAVVANEVKSLSRQTREATETIQNQINRLNASFGDVLGAVSNAQTTINGVIDKTERVAEGFEKINDNQKAVSDQIAELANIISQQSTLSLGLSENMHTIKEKNEANLDTATRLAGDTDVTVQLIEGWRAKIAKEDIQDKVVYLAQADHMLWKKYLLDIAVGRSAMRSSDLSSYTQCRLGRWYYDENATRHFRDAADFKEMEAPHIKVHEYGVLAARCFERGDLEQGMVHYRELEAASQKVVRHLKRLVES